MRFLTLLLTPLLCLAQPCDMNSTHKRYAFVVGNGRYVNLPQAPTAENDAQAMKEALERVGFIVTPIQNAAMPDLLLKDQAQFLDKVQPGDVIFFYYSGHIVQGAAKDDDFILPANFDISADVTTAFSIRRFLEDLGERKPGLTIFMIEGPRPIGVPILGTEGIGLVIPDLRDNGEILFAMSAEPDQVASSEGNAVTSLFTRSVAQLLGQPGLSPSQVFDQARVNVINQPGRNQIPGVADHLSGGPGGFCFLEPVSKVEPAPPPPVVIVQRVETVPTNKNDRQEYVFIPDGKFKMGCVPADKKCDANERPQHDVTLSSGFWMGRTEVTVSAYQRFVADSAKRYKMPGSPNYNSGWRSGDFPMVLIKWDEAQAFCTWAGGRLPTEAEWEYAARGGKTDEVYPLNSENSRDKANFYGTSLNDRWEEAAPVHQFDPNPFNLFDMAGNVWEWVADGYGLYSESPVVDPQHPKSPVVIRSSPLKTRVEREHVTRGGSFESKWQDDLRLSVRKSLGSPSYKVGFRCILEDNAQTNKLLNINKLDPAFSRPTR